MQYTTKSTKHKYSVFVVWQTMSESNNSKRKDRAIVDIRELNKIVVTDNYSISLQTNIISAVAECSYISIFDAAEFFHQWLVKFVDRHKLTVVSYREQKYFNVAIMSFKNSSLYIQRKIDSILREFREFCRVYIDDIVVFSRTLKEHLCYLHKIFMLLNKYNIFLMWWCSCAALSGPIYLH